MPEWRERIRSQLRKATGWPSGAEVYAGLRSMVLGIDPAAIQVPPQEALSGAIVAAMEIGLENRAATAMVVAIADGTVSMYLSTGGGVIGAGAHAAVRGAAERFRIVVAESRGLLLHTQDFPMPETGQVRFHARTADGAYSGVAPKAALRGGRHPLSVLYAAGQDLLTEIRLSSTRPQTGT